MAKRIKYIKVPESDWLDLSNFIRQAVIVKREDVNIIRKLSDSLLKAEDSVKRDIDNMATLGNKIEDYIDTIFTVYLDVDNNCLIENGIKIKLTNRETQIMEVLINCYNISVVANYNKFTVNKGALKHIVKRLNNRFNKVFQIINMKGAGYYLELLLKDVDEGLRMKILTKRDSDIIKPLVTDSNNYLTIV